MRVTHTHARDSATVAQLIERWTAAPQHAPTCRELTRRFGMRVERLDATRVPTWMIATARRRRQLVCLCVSARGDDSYKPVHTLSFDASACATAAHRAHMARAMAALISQRAASQPPRASPTFDELHVLYRARSRDTAGNYTFVSMAPVVVL
jgi:hypothetical protein